MIHKGLPRIARLMALLSTYTLLTGAQSQVVSEPVRLRLPISIVLTDKDIKPTPIGYSPVQKFISVTDSIPRCVSDAFELPGQAWHIDVSAGGITLQAGTPDYPAVTPQSRADALGLTGYMPQRGTVNVLILDNFQPTPVPLDEDGPNQGQGAVTYQLNHGALVTAHLKSVLLGSGFTVRPPTTPSVASTYDAVLVNAKGNRTIQILTFDVGNLLKNKSERNAGGVTTQTLARSLNASLKREQGGWAKINEYPLVINMSFALIPCNLQSEYFKFEAEALSKGLRLPFSTFLKAVADINLNLPFDASKPMTAAEQAYIRTLFTRISPTDPLLTWLDRRLRNRTAVAVASSGNYGLSFQTMPAAWPHVLGTGATRADTATKLDWSDQGDTLEVGEWFNFTSLPADVGCLVGPGCILAQMPAGTPPSVANFGYRGTSFSSPTVTAALAIKVPMTSPATSSPQPCFVNVAGYLRFAPVTPKLTNKPFASAIEPCS